jgi:hypothetical protein
MMGHRNDGYITVDANDGWGFKWAVGCFRIRPLRLFDPDLPGKTNQEF